MSAFDWKGPSETADDLRRQQQHRAVSTRNLEQARKSGKNLSTIPGLSMKADENIRLYHGGAYCKAGKV